MIKKFAFCAMTFAIGGPTILAADVAVRAFEANHQFFAEIPEVSPNDNDVAYWLIANDQDVTCDLINGSWARRAREQGGVSVYDSRNDLVYFLGDDGRLHSRPSADDTWTFLDTGAWLQGAQWQQNEDAGNGQHVTRYLVWTGVDTIFVQDPRPAFASRWYQLGPQKACHAFTEESRTYGPAGVQTVVLGTGIPGLSGWTLATGYADIDTIELVGNWLSH